MAAGSRAAFEELYNDRWHPLFHLVRSIVADGQAAEDITTETFLKAWQRRTDFADFEKFNGFLFQTARNACYNWLRDEERHAAARRYLAEAVAISEEPGWEEREIAGRVYQYLFDEIAQLPANMQAILRAHLEGKKNAAIAADLGLAEKTVRNLKTEAIRLLRLRLSNTEFALFQLLCWAVHHGLN